MLAHLMKGHTAHFFFWKKVRYNYNALVRPQKNRQSVTSRNEMGGTRSYNLFTRKPLALWRLGGMHQRM